MSTKDGSAGAAGTTPARSQSSFDPDRAYRRSPSVALRPEPFGALVYHFGTRKLSFLKTPQLVDVVTGLERHADVHDAIEAAGVDLAQRPAYLRALAGLADAGTIEPRPTTATQNGEPA
ncbi:MAG TPA: mycofactocin biosynthesis chaperone MftB [Pseudonocardia sp.]